MHATTFNREDALDFGFSAGVIATLGICSLPGVGQATLRQLGDPAGVTHLFAEEDLGAFTNALNSMGAKFSPEAAKISDWQGLKEFVWREGRLAAAELISHEVRCVTPTSALYPHRLHDLRASKPNWLFLKGNIELLAADAVAVVGTRSPSQEGEFLAKYAVASAGALGFSVISGLAKGIDSVAHDWALCVGAPTISILGTGILMPYPARNAGLAERIVQHAGLLVSEYLPHQGPSGENFVWRNRLQACLSTSVVAAQWKKSSGTAHTIRFAKQLGRGNASLALVGALPDAEAGRGDVHFDLPVHHREFVEFLAAGHVPGGAEARNVNTEAYAPGESDARDSGDAQPQLF